MSRRFITSIFVTFILGVVCLIASTPQIASSDVIQSKYWQTGPVLSQMGNECVAYALATFLEASPSPIMQHPSEDWIYFGAKARDGLNIPYDGGTSVEAGVQYLEDEGYVQSAIFTQNVVDMRNWILTNGPIVIEAAWPSQMGSPDSTGLAIPLGKHPTQHAFECYGWDGNTYSFWCQNEWGLSYGIKGKFRITEEGMNTLVGIYLHAALIVKNTL